MQIKLKNRVTSKIKTGHYIGFLTPETMKLLGGTKDKIAKVENDENVLLSEINEVVLVPCNIVNNDYQLDSKALYRFVSNKSFGQY